MGMSFPNGVYYDNNGREAPDPFISFLQSLENERNAAIEKSDRAYAKKPQELELRRRVRKLFPNIRLPGDRSEYEDQILKEYIKDGRLGFPLYTGHYVEKRWKITDFKLAETERYNIYVQTVIRENIHISPGAEIDPPFRLNRIYLTNGQCRAKKEEVGHYDYFGLSEENGEDGGGILDEPISTPRKPFMISGLKAREVKIGKDEDKLEIILDLTLSDEKIRQISYQYPGRYQPDDD